MSNDYDYHHCYWRDAYTDKGHEYHDLLEKYQRLEASTRELLGEVITDRDSLFDSSTNAEGKYDPGEDGREDRLEIERLDALIDRARAALGEA